MGYDYRNPKITDPTMLDVHPPHAPTHTWRDFFIHIATIVIGLLIAIGLEQAVEALHHHHLAHQARERLESERESNQGSNEFNIYSTHRHQRDLQHDLALIHAARAHTAPPPGPFILHHPRYVYLEDEWHKIHQSGTINYLDQNLAPLDYRYYQQDAFMERMDESTKDLYRAGAVLRQQDDPLNNTLQSNVEVADFLKKIADSHETLNEEQVRRGYARWAERADLTRLTPAQLDRLEIAIQTAISDDDDLLSYCFNIKRNLIRNPQK